MLPKSQAHVEEMMSDEPEEEQLDDDAGDFEGDDLDGDDLDLTDLDDDDDVDFVEDDDDDAPRSSGGSRKDDDELLTKATEEAVVANPKRQAVQKKRARVIEGILDTAELTTEEGRTKAWAALQKQAGDAKPRKYDMKGDYTESDVVNHPKFGEGYVVEILTPTKMSVLFEEGLRRLAQNK